ncbi:hypothetical protein [Gemmatimonas sp.]|uniref:hypothetical protein n=1 Tax=Gemmatimonas sp. TaxID=1962908 RepID=UPI00356708BF
MTLPSWLGADWLQAVVGALAVGAGILVGSAALLVLAFMWDEFDGVHVFQSIFLFASAAFGAGFTLESSDGYVSVSALAVPLVFGTVLLARIVTDRAAGAIAPDTNRLRAFTGKMAVATALLAVAATKLAAIKFDGGSNFDEARFAPSPGKAFIITLFLVVLGALLSRYRAGVRVPPSWVKAGSPGRIALLSCGATSGLTLAVVLTYSLIEANGVTISAVSGSLVTLLFFGGTISGGITAFSMGAPAAFSVSSFDARSIHIFNSGVPGWAKLMLLIAPIVVASMTWRCLVRSHPRSQSEVIRFATTTGVVFAVCCCAGKLISNVSVWVDVPDTDFFALDLSHNVLIVFALGLTWGLVGSFAAAVVWGKQHDLPLIVFAPVSATPTPPDLPAAPDTDFSTLPFIARSDVRPPDPSMRRD